MANNGNKIKKLFHLLILIIKTLIFKIQIKRCK